MQSLNEVNTDIDLGIPDGPPRSIQAKGLRILLKKVTQYVTDIVNTHLSTWNKMGGGVSGATTDDIYHLGRMAIGRADEGGTAARFSVHDPATFKQLLVVRPTYSFIGSTNSDGMNPTNPINELGAAQLSFGANTIPGSSDMALVHSNYAGGGFTFWQQVGLNSKNLLMWLTGSGNLLISNTILAPTEKLHVQGNAFVAGALKFPAAVAQRRVVLYPLADNDHQFQGFGVNAGVLRYQVAATTDAHVFYAGSSPVTSAELMRIVGTGAILMGTATNNGVDRLQLNGSIVSNPRSKSGNPTTADLPAGNMVAYKNTANGECRLWWNDGGAMKSILFS